MELFILLYLRGFKIIISKEIIKTTSRGEFKMKNLKRLTLTILLFFFLGNIVLGQFWEGEEDIYNTNRGNVGIGTEEPNYKLDVNGIINGANFYLNGSPIGIWEISSGKYIYYQGNVGIGTSNPVYKLDVNGDSRTTNNIYCGNYLGIGTVTPSKRIEIQFTDETARTDPMDFDGILISNNTTVSGNGAQLILGSTNAYFGILAKKMDSDAHVLDIWKDHSGQRDVAMRINSDGKIGIGTTNPQSLLSVNGTITSKEIKVTETGWSDFVFEEKYDLPSLNQLEMYIKQNKHLPGIPSAEEVKQNGFSLGEMQSKLLQKIEELTLYVIEQNKKLNAMEKENEALKQRITILEKQKY